MRLTLLALPALALSACAVAPQPTAAPAANIEPMAVFDVPMDPGLISCSALSNPAAMSAAVEWTIGQARAGVLAGRVADLPDESNMAQAFAAYCPANPESSVRDAAIHWGLAS